MHQTSKSNFFNKRSKGLFSLGSESFHVDKEGYYLALVDLLASLLENYTMQVNSFLNSNSYFHVQVNNYEIVVNFFHISMSFIVKK